MTTTTPDLDAAGRDHRVEAWLDSLHIPWTYTADQPIDRIDLKAGLRNQARTDAIDPEIVERYEAALTDGAVFPPVLLRRINPRRKLIPLGGNHRLAAHTNQHRTTITAYIVDVDDQVAPLLAYGDNAHHGQPPTRTERVAQAVHLIEACGLTQANAAAAVGLPAPVISKAQTAAAGSRRAHDLDVGTLYDTLPAGHRERLATIPADAVFAAATRLTKLAALTQPDTGDLVKRVKAARSEKTALALVDAELEDRRADMQATAARSGQRTRRDPDTAYTTLRRLTSRLDVLQPSEVAASCPTAEAARDTRTRVKETARRLMEIDKRLALAERGQR